MVQAQLERRGHVVELRDDVALVVAAMETRRPDLVILDLELPGGDGVELFRCLRPSGVPLVLLSPSAGDEERVVGLELGAADFVPSPVFPREVVARVDALLRERNREPSLLDCGGFAASRLVVDERARRVWIDGSLVRLTALELRLLLYFMRHPNEVLSRDDLFEQVWGYSIGDCSTVTVHVRRLRAKVERDPAHPSLIRTVWGTGYRFDPDDG